MRLVVIASLLLSNAALADGRVLWTGESSPWVELLRAELAVLDVEVVHTGELPSTDAAILGLLGMQDAMALVVSDDPAVLWLPSCDGGVRATRVPTLPSPGRSTVLISELVWAHARSDCPRIPAVRTPMHPPPVELVADAPASLSSPVRRTPGDEPLARDEPLAGDEPLAEPFVDPPERDDQLGPFLRAELLHGRDNLVGPFDFAIGGGWRVHPHLGFVARGSFSRRARTNAPIDRALVATASTGVQVAVPLGGWRLDIEGGPALVWLRADFEPNLGVDPQRRTFAGYFFGTSLEMPIAERIGLQIVGRVTNTGRRRDVQLIGRELGHWGAIIQAGLGLSVSL